VAKYLFYLYRAQSFHKYLEHSPHLYQVICTSMYFLHFASKHIILFKGVLEMYYDKFFRYIHFLLIQDTWDVERSIQLYITDIAQMYGISTAIFLASTIESLGNSLHFNSTYHLGE